VQIRYLLLMKYTESNFWYLDRELNDEGQEIAKNQFYNSMDEARAMAVEILGFDEEANGTPVCGINYYIIPVPFDETIKDES